MCIRNVVLLSQFHSHNMVWVCVLLVFHCRQWNRSLMTAVILEDWEQQLVPLVRFIVQVTDQSDCSCHDAGRQECAEGGLGDPLQEQETDPLLSQSHGKSVHTQEPNTVCGSLRERCEYYSCVFPSITACKEPLLRVGVTCTLMVHLWSTLEPRP